MNASTMFLEPSFRSEQDIYGRSVDPKDAVASRRMSPSPDAYNLQGSIEIKPKYYSPGNFDSKEARFRNSPIAAA